MEVSCYQLAAQKLIDLIEPNANGDLKAKEGEYVVDLQHWKKRTLVIISVSMKYEIVSHIVGLLDLAIMW